MYLYLNCQGIRRKIKKFGNKLMTFGNNSAYQSMHSIKMFRNYNITFLKILMLEQHEKLHQTSGEHTRKYSIGMAHPFTIRNMVLLIH